MYIKEIDDILLNLNKKDIDNIYLDLIEKYDSTLIDWKIYDYYNYSYEHKYEKNNDKIEERIKRTRQYKFRKELEDLYNYSCIISGIDKYDACHIIPYTNCNQELKYSKYNGILLKKDLHELFDNYIFSINPNTLSVEFNNEFFINKSNKLEFERFNNKKLTINKNDKLIFNLQQHYNIFIEKNKLL